MKRLKQLLGRIKFLLHSAKNIAPAVAVTIIKGFDAGNDKTVHVWIDLNERQNVFLLVALAETGTVSCHPLHALSFLKLLSASLFLSSVRISWLPPRKGCLISASDGDLPKYKNIAVIDVDRNYYSSDEKSSFLIMPYFAHPIFYKNRLYKLAPSLRSNCRTVKILFAGTNSKDAYTQRFGFPILTRDIIIDFLMAGFKNEIATGLIKVVITNDTRDVINKYSLGPSEYLHQVSLADFFVCPPGWLMPHSHNMVEAMSVGTIPITNYSHYVRPALEPGVNCLSFESTDEFGVAVETALAMTQDDIEVMRQNVVDYYDSILDPAGFGRKLRSSIGSIERLIVNDESGM